MSEWTDGNVLYSTTVDNLAEAVEKNGVLTGLAVSENATPNMSVNVAVGSAFANGTYRNFASQTNVPLDASDGTHNRLDLIILNSAGSLTKVTGTAATPPNPPDLPDGAILLAIVEVDATVTAIYNADIQDWRLFLGSIQEEMLGNGEVTDAKTNFDELSVATKVTTPKVTTSGDLTLESTGGNLILAPSTKILAQDDLVLDDGVELQIENSSGTLRGVLKGSASTLIIGENGNIELKAGASVVELEISTGGCWFKKQASPATDCDAGAKLGTTNSWHTIFVGTVTDNQCSEYPEPQNALEIIAMLPGLLPQGMPKGRIHSRNYPSVLKPWDEEKKAPKEKGRSLSAVVDHLIYAIAEIKEKLELHDTLLAGG